MPKVLTEMLNQYRFKHGHSPTKILVAPVAALALALKGSLGPVWNGIPIEMSLFPKDEVVKPGEGTRLGVFLKQTGDELRLVSCDLN